MRLGAWIPLLLALGCGERGHLGAGGAGGAGGGRPHLIYIDIDDHGLSVLWDAQAPNLQRLAKEGLFGFSRVDLPTHSNQNNYTLLTGAWPERTNVPHNAYLSRTNGFRPEISFDQLGLGDYVFWDKNPVGQGLQTIYDVTRAAGRRSAYVGLLPPWERGADDIHFAIFGAKLLGFLQIDQELVEYIFDMLRYPKEVRATFHYDGPAPAGVPLNRYTFSDAAAVWRAASAGGAEPPDVMFVWTLVALDDQPTENGANAPAVAQLVGDIDRGLGELMDAVKAAGHEGDTSYVLTLDHGKVDADKQAAFADQLAKALDARPQLGVKKDEVKVLDEEGDAQVYAVTAGAGTPAGAARQAEITHVVTELVQAGTFEGIDTRYTLTWDGHAGTRRFSDVRASGPNQADVLVFPKDGYVTGDVAKTKLPGPIGHAYGRHGGMHAEELYVPVFFWGPAFARGMIENPIEHADIAATALAAVGLPPPATSQGVPLLGFLASAKAPAELVALPPDPRTARDLVTLWAGYSGQTPVLHEMPADGVVVIDVAGLRTSQLEAGLAHAPHLVGMLERGAWLTDMRTRWLDGPVNAYQMLTGTYPVRTPWVPFAEGDPTETAAPGLGRVALAEGVADPKGLAIWHDGRDRWDDETVFHAAKSIPGVMTGAFGATDEALRHVSMDGLDAVGDATALDTFLQGGARGLAYFGVDGGTDPVAAADGALAAVERALGARRDQWLVVVTSHGVPIDSIEAGARADARRVPLLLVGVKANVRERVLVSGTATPADLAPTILFALGAQPRAPDTVFGLQIAGLDGGPGGLPQPLPAHAFEGRVLVQAFHVE